MVSPRVRKRKRPPKKPNADGFVQFEKRVCICGCNEVFEAYRRNQVFKHGHYRNGYVSHACPDCGTVHLVKVGK